MDANGQAHTTPEYPATGRHRQLGDDLERRTYLMAYRLADELQQPVLIVWSHPKAERRDMIPCVVTLDQADAHERTFGELVMPRRYA